MSIFESILGSLKLTFAGWFKGNMKQNISGNKGPVVAAQSKGAPATATFTMTPVIERLVIDPAKSVEEINRKIERMIKEQENTAGKKPGGILIDEREFSILVRDLPPGSEHGLLKVHKDIQVGYESVVTYDGVPVNRIVGLGLPTPNQE